MNKDQFVFELESKATILHAIAHGAGSNLENYERAFREMANLMGNAATLINDSSISDSNVNDLGLDF